MNNETKIKKFLDSNYGYITTSDFLSLNISKPLIKKYIDNGLIRKVSHGIYMDNNLLTDEEYVFQKRYPDAIFSYKTAFSMLGFINEEPKQLEVTIKNKKRVHGNYKIHYVSDKFYNVGIVEVKSIFGNPIKVYNTERCICDMLKSNEFDLALQKSILHNYFRSNNKNINRLLEYSKMFNVYTKVSTLVNYAIE